MENKDSISIHVKCHLQSSANDWPIRIKARSEHEGLRSRMAHERFYFTWCCPVNTFDIFFSLASQYITKLIWCSLLKCGIIVKRLNVNKWHAHYSTCFMLYCNNTTDVGSIAKRINLIYSLVLCNIELRNRTVLWWHWTGYFYIDLISYPLTPFSKA